MEVDNVTVLLPQNPNRLPAEPNSRSKVLVQGPRVCPLCSSQIKQFFINFDEKLLMCENIECEFPFGYEDLQFVQVDKYDNETGTVKTRQTIYCKQNSTKTCTTMSDIEKLYKACESDRGQSQNRAVRSNRIPHLPCKKKLSEEKELEIQKGLQDISLLTTEMAELDNQMAISDTISNKKLIKSLFNLQGASGITLLKPQELNKIEKNPKRCEVKIDIEKRSDVPLIKIELLAMNKCNSINKN